MDNASGELEDIRNPRLLRWPDAGLEILHDTRTWLGTLSMSVDTVAKAETAACSLKVNGDIGDNHRGVAPDTMKQL